MAVVKRRGNVESWLDTNTQEGDVIVEVLDGWQGSAPAKGTRFHHLSCEFIGAVTGMRPRGMGQKLRNAVRAYNAAKEEEEGGGGGGGGEKTVGDAGGLSRQEDITLFLRLLRGQFNNQPPVPLLDAVSVWKKEDIIRMIFGIDMGKGTEGIWNTIYTNVFVRGDAAPGMDGWRPPYGGIRTANPVHYTTRLGTDFAGTLLRAIWWDHVPYIL